jgi:hypothetical protein
MLASAPARSLNHIRSIMGIPDSIFPEGALSLAFTLPSEFWQPDRDAKTKTILSTPKAPFTNPHNE